MGQHQEDNMVRGSTGRRSRAENAASCCDAEEQRAKTLNRNRL